MKKGQLSCCGKYFPYQQMQEQRHKNNNIWEMAGELWQENKGKTLPERLWDSSPMAAWLKGCRGAGGKPLALKKVPSVAFPQSGHSSCTSNINCITPAFRMVYSFLFGSETLHKVNLRTFVPCVGKSCCCNILLLK